MKTLGGKDLEFARKSAFGLGYLFGHLTKEEAKELDRLLALERASKEEES